MNLRGPITRLIAFAALSHHIRISSRRTERRNQVFVGEKLAVNSAWFDNSRPTDACRNTETTFPSKHAIKTFVSGSLPRANAGIHPTKDAVLGPAAHRRQPSNESGFLTHCPSLAINFVSAIANYGEFAQALSPSFSLTFFEGKPRFQGRFYWALDHWHKDC